MAGRVTGGNLRLLDANRLIGTRALRALGPGQTLDRVRRPIHAQSLRRLMYLDAAFCGRDSDQLDAAPSIAATSARTTWKPCSKTAGRQANPRDRPPLYSIAPAPRRWHHG
ncbi:hypothetical protein [Streptacidiphilus sp. EB103A]|uniref:hypothetical protein n=1 Tax=Streptacidiphilus sp. EB103A TaxID=3156275 RepID=UPI003518BC7D